MAFDQVEMDEGEGGFEGDDSPQDLVALQRELERERQAREAAEQERERERERLDRWLESGGQAASQPSSPPPLGPAPDPTEDPEKFRTWIAERDKRSAEELERRLARQERETETRIGAASRQAELWRLFTSSYPKHAERTELAGTAYQRVVQRGVLDRSTDKEVVDAVRAEMDKIVGAPIDKIGSPEGDRTKGLSGGERGIVKRKPRQPSGDAPTTLHESISKRQLDFGLI